MLIFHCNWAHASGHMQQLLTVRQPSCGWHSPHATQPCRLCANHAADVGPALLPVLRLAHAATANAGTAAIGPTQVQIVTLRPDTMAPALSAVPWEERVRCCRMAGTQRDGIHCTQKHSPVQDTRSYVPTATQACVLGASGCCVRCGQAEPVIPWLGEACLLDGMQRHTAPHPSPCMLPPCAFVCTQKQVLELVDHVASALLQGASSRQHPAVREGCCLLAGGARGESEQASQLRYVIVAVTACS